jgi:Tol biopolymer transport system component/serine/threonine protein kinase
MNIDRWQRIKEIYDSALDLEPGGREAYLGEACAGDESLRQEVEALLANLPEADGFMKDPAVEVAARGLARDQASKPEPDYVGRSLLQYRIVEKIGEGGMGVVFLAEDSSLNRKVAMKFLPQEMQQDSTARKRFLREARSAAALDHPYICHINEVGEAEGTDFIVMEYVDGQMLTDKFQRGRLSLKQVLQIAEEVLEALEAAHGKGIIHRDLKPSNIMLTQTGHAKVMDFGLAKQLIPAGGIQSQEESMTALTRSGMTLGTLAYMSPEQLRGETIDARSDIFSFGVVLYEMLAGVHPFKKKTGMDTASAILNSVPQPLSELRPDTPGLLQHIVKKMLAKDPKDRYPSMHDVRTDLRELMEESNRPARGNRRGLKPLYWIAATALVVVGAGIWTFFHFFSRGAALPPPRFVPVTTSGGEKASPSLSPDGNWVAFAWTGEKQDNWDIYVKEVEGPGFNRLTTDPAEDFFPAWSPDGRQIAFVRASGDRWILYLISPLGGGERKLAEVGLGRLNWSPDGKNIAFVDRKSPKDPLSIWLLSVETLEKRQMTAPDVSYYADSQPAFSPNGRYLAFVRVRDPVRPALFLMELPRGEPRLVTDDHCPYLPCWTADSREIVYNSCLSTGDVALWRIFADGGEPHRVPARGEGAFGPTVSRNRLAYVSATGNSDIWRLELTGQDAMKPPSKPLFSWSSSESDQRISPDGSRIAFASDASGSMEIWVCNADGTKPMKLTDMQAGSTGSPTWSPDGKNIAFDSTKSGSGDINVVEAEGGPVRQITTDPTEEVVPRWSRDGRWIYFGSNRSGSWLIWKVPSDGGKPIQITRDGGMVACESADGYVYYHGYYDLQKKGIWRVPASGGSETLVLDKEIDDWDLSDRGIYFIDDTAKPMATICFYDFATRSVSTLAPVHSDPGFGLRRGFSVSPDGKWLLYSGGIGTSNIMMIDNFR